MSKRALFEKQFDSSKYEERDINALEETERVAIALSILKSLFVHDPKVAVDPLMVLFIGAWLSLNYEERNKRRAEFEEIMHSDGTAWLFADRFIHDLATRLGSSTGTRGVLGVTANGKAPVLLVDKEDEYEEDLSTDEADELRRQLNTLRMRGKDIPSC